MWTSFGWLLRHVLEDDHCNRVYSYADMQNAVNRERFMERTGMPMDFSTFQMQTFLKASNFRCLRSAWVRY